MMEEGNRKIPFKKQSKISLNIICSEKKKYFLSKRKLFISLIFFPLKPTVFWLLSYETLKSHLVKEKYKKNSKT